jgi:hypothetical protein
MILAYCPRPGRCTTIYAEGKALHLMGSLNTPSAPSFLSFIIARRSFDFTSSFIYSLYFFAKNAFHSRYSLPRRFCAGSHCGVEPRDVLQG